MREILDQLVRWRDRGDEHMALATVLATRRSATRPVGSKPAVSEHGELAVSILAEILAVRAGRSGGWLRDASGRIHAGLQPK
jgi:xanthine/CO dehydrogenase XdhC/CoxF family maturation factor